MSAKNALASKPQDGTYAIFTGSGVRIDLASFFRTESGKKALKEVAESAKRLSTPRSKGNRLGR